MSIIYCLKSILFMKKPHLFLFASVILMSSTTYAQIQGQPKGVMPMKPEMTEIYTTPPPIVTPGKTNSDAPSDAIVLFDKNTNLKEWMSVKDTNTAAAWTIYDGYFEEKPGAGDIKTKRKFADIQLHIEWSEPFLDTAKFKGQDRGNSGVFFQENYELQILDSYQNNTYCNGQAGSIYKDQAPLVNAMRPPGEWNVYDVIYTAPKFKKNGKLDLPARMTVFHNGVLIQNNSTIQGLTQYIGLHYYPAAHGEGSIKLQDHGHLVRFRNIWVREL